MKTIIAGSRSMRMCGVESAISAHMIITAKELGLQVFVWTKKEKS